jgi:hypothetical protein
MAGISKLDSAATTDNGCCILSNYVTYAFADSQDRERLQLGLAMALYPYALVNMEGSGQVAITMLPETLDTPYPFEQAPFTLADPALGDVNVPLNVVANRAFFQITSVGQSCANWNLLRIDMGCTPNPAFLVTGM